MMLRDSSGGALLDPAVDVKPGIGVRRLGYRPSDSQVESLKSVLQDETFAMIEGLEKGHAYAAAGAAAGAGVEGPPT